MEKTTTREILITKDILSALFGTYDENIRVIEDTLKVKVSVSASGVSVRGENTSVLKCCELLEKLITIAENKTLIDKATVKCALDMTSAGKTDEIVKLNLEAVAVTARGRPIRCKTLGQKAYADAIKANPLVFGVGPAGTGKTYLAVALATAAFKKKEIERIILTRPALEAGEQLGFLPGDLQQKVDPYLRPLYDALEEMFGVDSYLKLIENGIVEIAPLAYMRGRTLSKAFIILDEAQNTTEEQMKMFLTRMGKGSKMIVNGDVTQVDLPHGKNSGLKSAIGILKNVEGIAICKLTNKDIVRNELVQRIVEAYERKMTTERKPPVKVVKKVLD